MSFDFIKAKERMQMTSPAAPTAPSFKPVPQAANVPATAPSKTSDPFDWENRPVEEMRYRYEVWNALGQEKPSRVEVFLKASPAGSKTVTPREIDEKGLSFSAVNADGATEKIAFGDVSRLRVLSA